MKWKWITVPVIILLIGMNLLLLIFYLVENRRSYTLDSEEIERITAIYEEEGITFAETPSAKVSKRKVLTLTDYDLDKLATTFLEGNSLGGKEYDLTYIYGSKVQYTAGSIVISTDRENHRITYRDNEVLERGPLEELTQEQQQMLASAARVFAAKWLGEDVMQVSCVTTGAEMNIRFCQMLGEEAAFFNYADVIITARGISQAQIQYFDYQDKETARSLPVDELLYMLLGKVAEQSKGEGGVVKEIVWGYEIDRQSGLAYPDLTLVMSTGELFTLRCDAK